MTFIVIDPHGDLTVHGEPVTHAGLNQVMPTNGFELVRLALDPRLYAFVDEAGHPTGLPRNPTGACVIASLGARASAYCGPIVITGWQEPDEESELRDLDDAQLHFISTLHGQIRDLLEHPDDRPGPLDRLWLAARIELVDYAEWVRSSATPQIQIIGLGGDT